MRRIEPSLARLGRAGTSILAAAASTLLAAGLEAATIRGTLTECFASQAAPGYVIQAFEELTVGLPDLGKPCTIGTQSPQRVGTATTGADGKYSITYAPTQKDPEDCFFEAKVFVRVLRPDGATPVLTSAREARRTTNVFDFDVCPEACPLSIEGPTVIEGEAGKTATFDVSVFLGGPPHGFGAQAFAWQFEMSATGAEIISGSYGGTAAEQAESARVHVDPPNPFDPPNCPNDPILTSVVVTAFDRSVSLALGNGPQLVLRARVQAVMPSFLQSSTCRIYFPLDCPHVGFKCILKDGSGSADAPITRVRDLEVELRGVGVLAPPFRRADINGSGEVDISDAVATFEYLFLSLDKPPPACLSAGDSNGDGVIDISDGVNTLVYLFAGGEGIPSPGPTACGTASGDGLDCGAYGGC